MTLAKRLPQMTASELAALYQELDHIVNVCELDFLLTGIQDADAEMFRAAKELVLAESRKRCSR